MTPHNESGWLGSSLRAPSAESTLLGAARTPTPATQQRRPAFTLIEMLIAMAITLVMIGAVVTLFANISNSVRNRRAVVEVSGQLRHVRNMLQQDLQGATCPGLTWQRPEDNQGYIEIIEGPYRENYPSRLTDGVDSPPTNYELDPALSLVPRNSVVRDYNNNGRIDDDDELRHFQHEGSFVVRQDPIGPSDNNTNPIVASISGLGDGDDILMLTVRNEHEPFVGRVPADVRQNVSDAVTFGDSNGGVNWTHQVIESPLAEVVWYAVENPADEEDPDGYFGEPGLRTIYRRTLLIAPWLNPYRFVDNNGNFDDTFQIGGTGPTFTAKPGLLRILRDDVDVDEADEALAALIAVQERYDVSARLEWDPLLGSDGRWKIVANTLGDLTKRENRYEHHFFRPGGSREYPFAAVSVGNDYAGDNVAFAVDPEIGDGNAAEANGNLEDDSVTGLDNYVASYSIDPNNLNDAIADRRYTYRPFAYVDEDSSTLATSRAMLNNEGQVVRVIHGLVPLSRERRGEDVMLSDALGFDLRIYDPGAPLCRQASTDTIVGPSDPGWQFGYDADVANIDRIFGPDSTSDTTSPFVGQGAYVDLGYGFRRLIPRRFVAPGSGGTAPWFFGSPAEIEAAQVRYRTDSTPRYALDRGALGNVYREQLAPGYAVYDTWSFHYENNGINEDNDVDANSNSLTDEGTNGLDDLGHYLNAAGNLVYEIRLGPDDLGERETMPPYDRPLRGLQAVLRVFERDSRQLRQVTVNQNFVPE